MPDNTTRTDGVSRKIPWETLCVSLLCCVLYAVGRVLHDGDIVAMGANNRGLVRSGEWWRLLTNSFVHTDVNHLVANVIGLLIFGSRVEGVYGRFVATSTFVVSSITGSLASHFVSHSSSFSAGASAGVFGLTVVSVLSIYEARESLSPSLLFGYVAAGCLALYGGFMIPLSAKASSTDVPAHLGGIIGGGISWTILRRTAFAGRSYLQAGIAALGVVVLSYGVARTTVWVSGRANQLTYHDPARHFSFAYPDNVDVSIRGNAVLLAYPGFLISVSSRELPPEVPLPSQPENVGEILTSLPEISNLMRCYSQPGDSCVWLVAVGRERSGTIQSLALAHNGRRVYQVSQYTNPANLKRAEINLLDLLTSFSINAGQ